MLGAKSVYAAECLEGGFIGVGFFKDIDLTNIVSKYDEWRGFNKEMIPVYLEEYPDKSKIAAGLGCATTWIVSRGIESGDIVLSPNGSGSYMVGEVSGGYSYHSGSSLPHQRKITWFPGLIARNSMSDALKNSTGAIAPYCHITKHAAELETLLTGKQPNVITTTDDTNTSNIDRQTHKTKKQKIHKQTKVIQKFIDKHAELIMDGYRDKKKKRCPKNILATSLSEKLLTTKKITLKPDSIRKNYLKDWPYGQENI